MIKQKVSKNNGNHEIELIKLLEIANDNALEMMDANSTIQQIANKKLIDCLDPNNIEFS